MQARARATRSQLLDHTVEALVECGYAGTTTQEVCRRAGVSRGTLQYHYKTRIELLVAALEHVLSSVVHAFVTERVAEGTTEPHLLLRLMWEQWKGPALTAWLELAVAARTNEALRAPMRDVMVDFDDLVRQSFRTLFPENVLSAQVRDEAPFFVFALFNGLAVGRSYEDPGHETAVLSLLEKLVQQLLGDSP